MHARRFSYFTAIGGNQLYAIKRPQNMIKTQSVIDAMPT